MLISSPSTGFHSSHTLFEVTEAEDLSFIAYFKQHLTHTSCPASHPHEWALPLMLGGALIVAVVLTWLRWGNGCLISAAPLITAARSLFLQVGVFVIKLQYSTRAHPVTGDTERPLKPRGSDKRIKVLKTGPKCPHGSIPSCLCVCVQSPTVAVFLQASGVKLAPPPVCSD